MEQLYNVTIWWFYISIGIYNQIGLASMPSLRTRLINNLLFRSSRWAYLFLFTYYKKTSVHELA